MKFCSRLPISEIIIVHCPKTGRYQPKCDCSVPVPCPDYGGEEESADGNGKNILCAYYPWSTEGMELRPLIHELRKKRDRQEKYIAELCKQKNQLQSGNDHLLEENKKLRNAFEVLLDSKNTEDKSNG